MMKAIKNFMNKPVTWGDSFKWSGIVLGLYAAVIGACVAYEKWTDYKAEKEMLKKMFGSHHIMSKRNASLTAAYIAIDKAFNEYKGRVTERFGDRVQRELEHNIKAVEVESTAKNEDGTEEVIREYTDVARDANDPYSMIFDESCSLWEKDSMLNAMTIRNVENAANRKLRTNGHLFLNEVIDMLDPYGKGCHRTAVGQVAGWIYDPKDETKQNCVSLGTHCYVPGNEALNDFINGDERSVMLHFNCDGPIIDKI